MTQTPYQKFNLVDAEGNLLSIGGNSGGASSDNQTAQIGVEEEIRDGVVKNYGIWQTLANYASATPDNFNSQPATFTALASPPNKISKIQILPQISTAVAGSIYVWINDGTDIYSLSAIPLYPGQNGISTISGNALAGVDPYEFEVNIPGNSTFGTRTVVYSPITTFLPNGVSGTCFAANPGYRGGEQVSFATTGNLPRGLAGTIDSYNPSNNVVSISGVSFASNENCRINSTNIGATVIPPAGISSRFSAALVSLNTNEIVADGSVTAFSFAAGDTIRFRAAPGSVLPSIFGTAISPTVSYTVLSVSGSAGNQKLKISADGVNPVQITAPGQGLYYAFRYPYIPLTYLSGGTLSYDGVNPIAMPGTYSGTAISVTTPGTAASIADTAHPFVEGQAVVLGGLTAPTLGFLGMNLYVRNPTTNAYNLSSTPTGMLIAFTGTGTVVTISGRSVVVTAGTPGSVTFINHFLSTNQPFTIAATSLPSGYPSNTQLYIIANGLAANAFQGSEKIGYPPVVFGSAGTTVTITANIPGQLPTPIEKTTAYIYNTGITDSNIAFSSSNGGTIIPLVGGVGVHSITLVVSSTITGNILIRGIYE
ncbi:hypothetical protein [Nostoc sp. JL23]|uniref:hypothetical protein n=1 Tax=Nostoc sp. JL23 TaxID=2815394 RepID=UPI001D3F8EA5|nr:hypothetical protein [Nostoc sp. JL23]MBN3875255.1 hypothetical protein [Nostoc sp. JL23]